MRVLILIGISGIEVLEVYDRTSTTEVEHRVIALVLHSSWRREMVACFEDVLTPPMIIICVHSKSYSATRCVFRRGSGVKNL